MKPKTAIHQLKTVWGNAEPSLDQEQVAGKASRAHSRRKKSERTTQMNLRVRPDEKQRIALIALGENVSINEIFSRMLDLYEREHGRPELLGGKRGDG